MRSLLLIVLASCQLDYKPDLGEPFVEFPDGGSTTDGGGGIVGCDNADSDPAVAVSFSANIRPLTTRFPGGCAPCHIGQVTSGFDLSSYAGLRRGGTNSGTRIVVPNEPCNSILPAKLSRTPPFGSRMPFVGNPLTVEEQQLIRDWIAEGALNN